MQSEKVEAHIERLYSTPVDVVGPPCRVREGLVEAALECLIEGLPESRRRLTEVFLRCGSNPEWEFVTRKEIG